MSCLNSEIKNLCPEAAPLVNNFTLAVSSDLLRFLNCPVTTPLPEVTNATTAAPEPEPEATDSPATPEPGPEGTYSPTSPLPEAEDTTPSTQITSAPSTQCDMFTFNQCLSNFNKEIQVWVQAITSSPFLSSTLDPSQLESICRTYREEYKPCA